MATTTITLIDLADGQVSVRTDADRPMIGRGITPAQALAMELLGTSFKRGAEVLYDAQSVPAVALALELLDPEGLGHAVPGEVHDRARRALGRDQVATARSVGVDIDRVHHTHGRRS
ncbi:hypothetical protein J2789_004493 [Variovorax paradoxus]|uniref:hypothetical protein n=1 Tax=Variovorax atrisoli TaxID=3394203 RepID=UPI00119B9431|nr:hypothetical protein [Variovorax paradoxus]MDR6521803.1 hypothetical protein [Variovorax paradoxus]